MRFAWLQENSANPDLVKQEFSNPLSLIRKAYNAVFWIFLLPFIFTSIDYGTGFIAFSIVIIVRLVLNLYTNNVLEFSPQQFEEYPFRIP
jgi:hypothetical protein